jgi:tagaturonate reductase
MFHRMNAEGVFNGEVVVIQPLENGLVNLLNEQDGLYTLFLRGIQDGTEINEHELITSVRRGINPYSDWSAYLETAANPDLRFVVSNTTEAGIDYVKTDPPQNECPTSFPAKLTAWLAERFRLFGGSKESGIVFLPCELINHNGPRLKECILKHSRDWKLGDGFFQWLENHCVFLSTLVDRIVPGYPREEAEQMTAELGYEDRLLCAGEIFHLLVIEGPAELENELPFHKAGLNVIWTNDMQPYRTRKVGILNGAHTASVLGAFLGGLDTVRDMMDDEVFGRFIRSAVFDELAPALRMDRAETESYANAVIERFSNPYIRHELLSISLNSVSKWSVRVLPSLKNFTEEFGRVPPLLAFSMAALIAFYKGDLRAGYTPNDDPAVVEFFKQSWRSDDPADVVRCVLSSSNLWKEDLMRIPGFGTAVTESLTLILNDGARAAAAKILEANDAIDA